MLKKGCLVTVREDVCPTMLCLVLFLNTLGRGFKTRSGKVRKKSRSWKEEEWWLSAGENGIFTEHVCVRQEERWCRSA